MNSPYLKTRAGQLSLQILVFAAAALIVVSGFVLLIQSMVNRSLRELNKSAALAVAEAGIEYYRWHLAHDPADYQDGTGGAGPYIHPYYDKDGKAVGAFSLEITPPPLGSGIVTIESTGTVVTDPTVKKRIRASLGIPSVARYAWLLNSIGRFDEGVEVFGSIHANKGLRFDGTAHNLVTGSVSRYRDPDHTGDKEYGIHTHREPVDPLPPEPVPSRPDVFAASRQFPVPAVDFTGITERLADIKAKAQANGFYAAPSTAKGYEIVLKTNDTFDLYKVTGLVKRPKNCKVGTKRGIQGGWGPWSIKSKTLVDNYSFPANGLLFIEDHLWVRGQIDGARLTIASGKFPESSKTYTNIIVNEPVLYTNYDGTDVLGLIAQRNVTVGLKSADQLRLDAALVAQHGRVGRYSYNSSCGADAERAQIIVYGMVGSNRRPGFHYTANDGYQSELYRYDAHLLYGPPPSFPLAAGERHVQISWEELE